MKKFFLASVLVIALGMLAYSYYSVSKYVDRNNNANLVPQKYTLEDVLENKDSLLNKKIIVEGIAMDYDLKCTEEECGPDNQCCNSCGGRLGLKLDDKNYLHIRGKVEKPGDWGLYKDKLVNCHGNNCIVTCYPLEKELDYQITGILKREVIEYFEREEYYLELISFKTI